MFWALNTIAWITFYWHWKHLAIWMGNTAQFNESGTYLMGWFRDYLWLNSSQLINGYNPFGVNALSPWAWMFLFGHLIWATGFMFLISWRGYWQELIETLSEKDLADLIYKLGEEKRSRRIARKIKNDLSVKGPYSGTQDLSYAIAGCFPPKQRYGRIHPSTRTFQALRIAVNNELGSLESLLLKAPNWLLENGLFMVMSFHSLEDRRVKSRFKTDNRLKVLSKKPIRASPEEIELNPRSKSAKLRISAKKFSQQT